MKKFLVTILMIFLMLFGVGCNIESTQHLEIEQVEPYVCYVGDQLPFFKVKFDENSNVLVKSILGTYANKVGEVLIDSDQGRYHIIVKEKDITFEIRTNQLLSVGDFTNLYVNVVPLEKDQNVTFKSMDTSIVTVTNDGKVNAIGEGVTRIVIKSETYNIEKEITYVVLKDDEKYYEAIIDLIINNKEINLDASFDQIINGVIETNKSALVGISTYKLLMNRLVESDFGSGIIYKMNVVYNDGTILKDVKNAKDITDVNKIKNFEYYVITNRHLISDKYKTKIYTGEEDKEIDAELLQYDDKIDLAVLKFSSKTYFPVAKLGDSNNIQKGEFIVSIGNGTGKSYYRSSTFGVISSEKRYVNSDTNADGINDWDSEYIQHDAAINESDSGGAILNLKGEVIGINSTKISSLTFNNMSFAIPINLVMEIVSQLEQGIRPQRALLGVQILDITGYWQDPEYYKQLYPGIYIPDHIKYGFYVNVVDKGGVAEKAKVQVGDILLEFNNVEIRYSYQVRAELGKFLIGSGQIAEMKVYRNGEVITLYCEF